MEQLNRPFVISNDRVRENLSEPFRRGAGRTVKQLIVQEVSAAGEHRTMSIVFTQSDEIRDLSQNDHYPLTPHTRSLDMSGCDV